MRELPVPRHHIEPHRKGSVLLLDGGASSQHCSASFGRLKIPGLGGAPIGNRAVDQLQSGLFVVRTDVVTYTNRCATRNVRFFPVGAIRDINQHLEGTRHAIGIDHSPNRSHAGAFSCAVVCLPNAVRFVDGSWEAAMIEEDEEEEEAQRKRPRTTFVKGGS